MAGKQNKCCCDCDPPVVSCGYSSPTSFDYTISNATSATLTEYFCNCGGSSTTTITLTGGSASGTHTPSANTCAIAIDAENNCGRVRCSDDCGRINLTGDITCGTQLCLDWSAIEVTADCSGTTQSGDFEWVKVNGVNQTKDPINGWTGQVCWDYGPSLPSEITLEARLRCGEEVRWKWLVDCRLQKESVGFDVDQANPGPHVCDEMQIIENSPNCTTESHDIWRSMFPIDGTYTYPNDPTPSCSVVAVSTSDPDWDPAFDLTQRIQANPYIYQLIDTGIDGYLEVLNKRKPSDTSGCPPGQCPPPSNGWTWSGTRYSGRIYISVEEPNSSTTTVAVLLLAQEIWDLRAKFEYDSSGGPCILIDTGCVVGAGETNMGDFADAPDDYCWIKADYRQPATGEEDSYLLACAACSDPSCLEVCSPPTPTWLDMCKKSVKTAIRLQVDDPTCMSSPCWNCATDVVKYRFYYF